MLTIILGIVLAAIIVFVGMVIAVNSKKGDYPSIASVLAIFVVICAIILGLGYPASGYHEWELVNETELITLSNDMASGGTGLIYVSLSADNTYTYRYEIDSEFGTETSKEYQTATLCGPNVIEVEDPNCKIPVIRIYQRDGKSSIWTFAILTTQTEYVFYVPEGTIYKEVKLN